MSFAKKTNNFDIAIAGAGPAGCAAAIALAKSGLQVALIDYAEVPRHKVGESLPAAIVRLLHRLGIAGIPDLLLVSQYKPCVANASAWATDRWTYQDGIRNLEGLGWQINRSAFEVALRQKAVQMGVILKKAKITDVLFKNETYHCHLKTANQSLIITTKWLIDATGRSSKISRLLNIKKIQYSDQMAAVSWVKNSKNADAITRIKSVDDGWWYTTALPQNQRVVVFHGLADSVKFYMQNPDLFINHFNNSKIINKTLVTNSLIEKISGRDASVFKLKKAQQPNFFAIGDAVLSFDPLSSQGIFFALYSGIQVADLIIDNRMNHTSSNQLIQQYGNTIEQIFLKNQLTRQAFYDQAYWYHSQQVYWQRQVKLTIKN